MDADVNSPRTLPGLLAATADRAPQQVALVCADESVTFGALEERVRRVAAGFAAVGIGAGDAVGVWLPNSVEWAEVEFALARLGAVAIALNTKFRAHDIGSVLMRSRARALVLCAGWRNIDFLTVLADVEPSCLAGLEALVLVGGTGTGLPPRLGGKRVVRYREVADSAPLAEDHSAPGAPCIAFTSSGTTAEPKLVLHAQQAIALHAQGVARGFGYTGDDAVVLVALPVCGVFGFDTLAGALAAGCPSVLMPAFDGAEAACLIERHRVTHTNGTDEMLRRILHAGSPGQLMTLRAAGFANFGGDPRQLVDDGTAIGAWFFQTYGSSEVQALLIHPPADATAEYRAVSRGLPVTPGTKLRVRDIERGTLAGPGEPGELEISGPTVMAGYLNPAKGERAPFTDDGYLRSGDIGQVEDDGSLVYATRRGDALRLRGFLVSPQEIEHYLLGLPGIAAAQVVGVDTDRGTEAVAFVIPRDRAVIEERQVIESCRAGLASFKIPRRIVSLAEFPVAHSANGERVQRAKLREHAARLLAAEQRGERIK